MSRPAKNESFHRDVRMRSNGFESGFSHIPYGLGHSSEDERQPLGIPAYSTSDPAHAVATISFLAKIATEILLPDLGTLDQSDWWAVAMAVQRLEHPDDPAWAVRTPWEVRITSTAYLTQGIPGVQLDLSVDQHSLRLLLSGPLPADHWRLALAARFAEHGKPFWSACGPGIARALNFFRQQAHLFGSETTAEVRTVPHMKVSPLQGATGAPARPSSIAPGPTN